MRFLLLSSSLLLLFFCGASKLQILHPVELQAEFGYDATGDDPDIGLIDSNLAFFGEWYYGTTIQGRL